MIKVAVVILNWNGKNYLEKFLPSVIKHSDFTDVEIYIADNGSSDDSVSFIRKYHPNIRLILFDKNYGFAEGYNKALAQINAEYYILLNSDIEVTANWIKPVINILDKNKSVAACMPKIRAYHSKGDFEYAGAAGGFIDRYGYPFCRGRILNIIENDKGQYDNEKQIFWASGACLFVKADLFKNTGGFDPDFFCHMEEIDLCWRFKNQGYDIIYTPDVVVYHIGGGTLPNDNPQKLFLNFRNNLFLLYKNLPSSKLFSTITIRLLLDISAALIYLFRFSFRQFSSVIKAHYHFFKQIKKLKGKRKIYHSSDLTYKHPEIYNRSIVYDFFIKNIKFFQQLKVNNKS